jgi:hypothetical protein
MTLVAKTFTRICGPILPRFDGYHFPHVLIAGLLLFTFLFWVGSNSALAAVDKVGAVIMAKPGVFGTRQDGATAAKRLHDDVRMQERIETLPNSGTDIRLIDGTALTLGSDADLTIDELVFDPATKRGSSVLKLGTGTFYYVSGQMNREDIAIQTLSTTIGIRGTHLLITVAADGATAVGVVSGAARLVSRLTGETTLAEVGESASISRNGTVSKGILADIQTTDIVILESATKAVKGAIKKFEKKAQSSDNASEKGKAAKSLAIIKRNQRLLEKNVQIARKLSKGGKETAKNAASGARKSVSTGGNGGTVKFGGTARIQKASFRNTKQIPIKKLTSTKLLSKRIAKTEAGKTVRDATQLAALTAAKSAARSAAKAVAKSAAKEAAKSAAKETAKSAAKEAAKSAAKEAAKESAKNSGNGGGKGKGKGKS